VADILNYDAKSVFLQKASGPLLFASVFYVIINMVIMFFPHILYGLPIEMLNTAANGTTEYITKDAVSDTFILQSPTTESEVLNVVNVEEKELVPPQLFSNDYIIKIEGQLKICIEKEFYLDPDFRLFSLVENSGITPHHFSYYFNSVLNSSFSEWRNNSRIEYVIKKLTQGESKLLTLESLALQSGFTNQTTFIRAFKLSTGKTPSQYVKELKGQDDL